MISKKFVADLILILLLTPSISKWSLTFVKAISTSSQQKHDFNRRSYRSGRRKSRQRKLINTVCQLKRFADEYEFDREEPPTEIQVQLQPMRLREKPLPVLVVGGTGAIGRLVIEQLLAKDTPTRALVRDYDKAVEILGEEAVKSRKSLLEVVVGDVNDEEFLERAVKGCGAVISLCGTRRRITRLFDLLPWRLFSTDEHNVGKWCRDGSHPYYINFLAQKNIVKFSEKHNIQKIVRVSDSNVGLSSLDIRTILLNLAYSMSIKYQCFGEDAIRNSTIPSLILRPDQLTNEERDTSVTSVQVDCLGILPKPFIIGRSDIAALAVSSAKTEDDERKYTVATRWVGKLKGKEFSTCSKYRGKQNVEDCLQELRTSEVARIEEERRKREGPRLRPYASGVGMIVYAPILFIFKFLFSLSRLKVLSAMLPVFRTTLAYSVW